MSDIFTQLFSLTGSLIGFLLNWPFLLFVFLFWVANRYRDQIGSMLDRRGAVKAAVISKAVRHELEPISQQLEALLPRISALRHEVDQLKAEQSEDKLTPAIDAIRQQIASLEARFTHMQAESERMLRSELSLGLARERETAGQELTRLTEAFDAQERQLAALAPREAVDALAAALEPTRIELATVTDAIALLRTEVDAAASREEIDRLDRDSASIKASLDVLTEVVREVESMAKSAPEQLKRLLTEAEEPLRHGIETLTGEVNALKTRATGTADAATTDRLQRDLAQVKESVEALQQGLGSVQAEIEKRPAGPAEKDSHELTAAKEAPARRERPSAAPTKPQATKRKRTPKRAESSR